MSSAPLMKPGDRLCDRYRIRELIGQGGMSRVYLAEDLRLPGKVWAVKQALTPFADGVSFREEAELMIGLDHPFLPKLVDYIPPSEDGIAYLVMDYIKGVTLQQLHSKQGPLNVEQLGKYGIQLCELFSYLHEYKPKPIIYRDLKPSNIMIDEQDNVRLIDFGIARSYRQEADADTLLLGTVGFAAPEQFGQSQTDARTDLYCLGAVLYYLLGGGAHYPSRPKPTSFLSSEFAEGWRTFLERLLKHNPQDRWQSAREARQHLEALLLKERRAEPGQGSRTNGYRGAHKLILVTSLYKGAGATFVSIALARTLGRLGIRHTLIEYEGNSPELFTLLDGERSEPYGYTYYVDKAEYGSFKRRADWISGHTEWLPLPANYGSGDRQSQWSEEDYYRLLFEKKSPVAILDVSGCENSPAFVNLCRTADHLLFVGDPYANKWNMPEVRDRLHRIQSFPDAAVKTVWIANKASDFTRNREWLRSFPAPPLCTLPRLPEREILEANWEGKLAQDESGAAQDLHDALNPLLKQLLPDAGIRRSGKKAPFLTKLFQFHS